MNSCASRRKPSFPTVEKSGALRISDQRKGGAPSRRGRPAPGLLELEVLSVLRPGRAHSVRDLAELSGLSARTIREIEERALLKIRNAPEVIRLRDEFGARDLRGAA